MEEELIRIGSMMSNILYNLHSSSRYECLGENERNSMSHLQKMWDDELRTYRTQKRGFGGLTPMNYQNTLKIEGLK